MNKELIPLALAHAHDEQPVEGRTRLQKMVFLVQKELEQEGVTLADDESYHFWAYDYGPFSKELAHEIDELIGDEKLDENEEPFRDGKVKYQYRLTDSSDLLEDASEDKTASVVEKAQEIKNTYNEMPLPEVIDRVYTAYPEFAKNSVY
jgi:uncharacterized protein YwgA